MKLNTNHIYQVIWKDITFHSDATDLSHGPTLSCHIGILTKQDKEAIWVTNCFTDLPDMDYTWIPKKLITHAQDFGLSKLIKFEEEKK
jgi:hypothetical protein